MISQFPAPLNFAGHLQQSQPVSTGSDGPHWSAERGGGSRSVGQPERGAAVPDQRRRGALQHPGPPHHSTQPDRPGSRPSARIPHLLVGAHLRANNMTAKIAGVEYSVLTVHRSKPNPYLGVVPQSNLSSTIILFFHVTGSLFHEKTLPYGHRLVKSNRNFYSRDLTFNDTKTKWLHLLDETEFYFRPEQGLQSS